jgi:hypothetical protein
MMSIKIIVCFLKLFQLSHGCGVDNFHVFSGDGISNTIAHALTSNGANFFYLLNRDLWQSRLVSIIWPKSYLLFHVTQLAILVPPPFLAVAIFQKAGEGIID